MSSPDPHRYRTTSLHQLADSEVDGPSRRTDQDHRHGLARPDSPIKLAYPQSARQQAQTTRRRRRRRVALVIAAGAGANVLAFTQARSLADDSAGARLPGTGKLASFSSPDGVGQPESVNAADGPSDPAEPATTTTTSTSTTTTTTAPAAVVVVGGSAGRDLGPFMATCYDNEGETADGAQAGPGSVAVDPSVVPLGTRLWIQGVGYRTADDTGGAIRGRRIDIWGSSATACRDFGVRYLDVREVS